MPSSLALSKIFVGHFVKYSLQVDKKTQNVFLIHKLSMYKDNASEFRCISPCQRLEQVARLVNLFKTLSALK